MSNKVINVDYYGEPETAMSIKDIIKSFGAVYNDQTDKWELANSDKLDICPLLLEDDGMGYGYGVNKQYLIEGNFIDDIKQYHFYRDKEIEHIDICESVGVYPSSIIKSDDDTEYVVFNVVKLNDNYVFQCYEYDFNGMSEHKKMNIVEFSIDEVKQMKKYK